MSIEVKDDRAEHRYEAWLDGELAGVAVYGATEHAVVFLHTEVFPDFEGKGIGSALARGALDDVRAQGTRGVVPLCPFIAGWLEKHPDYGDLVLKRH